MRRILVTGANKGIGRAIVKAIVEAHADTFVYLGARDRGRGDEAKAAIGSDRVAVVTLDVTSDASVKAAAAEIETDLGGEKLYGVVNNAGVGHGAGATRDDMVQANTLGLRRVCEAFLPLLAPKGGRIVNVTSASGPSFVSAASGDAKKLLLDPNVTWEELEAFLGHAAASGSDAYGLSKAVANAYTVLLAREHPNLRINACTPGFIETDLTRGFSSGKSREELAAMGMKPPEAGTVSPLFLLFGEPAGNGRYYGSDAKRSPLDRYRSPGSPEYTGD